MRLLIFTKLLTTLFNAYAILSQQKFNFLQQCYFFKSLCFLLQKQQDFNKTKELIVLDHKRSNAINIAITKLPPARAIKIAISKMDSTVITREAIEKLMNLIPTCEETNRIQEAQNLNPDLPLGSAEQFLLTLSSISEIAARLKLWSFKLDFENIEKEIAEPLMDLKVVNIKRCIKYGHPISYILNFRECRFFGQTKLSRIFCHIF